METGLGTTPTLPWIWSAQEEGKRFLEKKRPGETSEIGAGELYPGFSRDATAASAAAPSAYVSSSRMRGIACGAHMAS